MKIGNFSVSIIIPTYNRAHLIRETLDSVVTQTYLNWECIIVDDGSTDNTDEVVGEYVKNDKRFKYFERTENYLSGGNGARNFGLDLAQGEYIVFFDSDDLMTDNHMQIKYDLINSGDYDFGVTRTKYFNHTNQFINKYYNFSTKDISKENYVLQHINWLTLDVIIKSSLAKQVQFNEIIKSGQEYNFFSKLVCLSDQGVFLDEVVSLRRHHTNSKRTTIASGIKKKESVAVTTWYTYLETKRQIPFNISKQLLFNSYQNIVNFKKFPEDIDQLKFWIEIYNHFKLKSIIKYIYFNLNCHTDRFLFLRKKALEK